MRATRKTVLTLTASAAALVLTSTGGAVAGSLVTSKQIADNTVRSVDIKNGTLNLRDIRPAARAALQGQDGADGEQGPAGVAGPAGEASGVAGPTGPAGPRGATGGPGQPGLPGDDGVDGFADFQRLTAQTANSYADSNTGVETAYQAIPCPAGTNAISGEYWFSANGGGPPAVGTAAFQTSRTDFLNGIDGWVVLAQGPDPFRMVVQVTCAAMPTT